MGVNHAIVYLLNNSPKALERSWIPACINARSCLLAGDTANAKRIMAGLAERVLEGQAREEYLRQLARDGGER